MSEYKVNGTRLLLQPTTGQWMPREEVGRDGNGRAIYPMFRQFELTWQLIDMQSAQQIQAFFESIGSTGTSVVDLPRYMSATGGFFAYSGCNLSEPMVSPNWELHLTDVRLLVSRIRTHPQSI